MCLGYMKVSIVSIIMTSVLCARSPSVKGRPHFGHKSQILPPRCVKGISGSHNIRPLGNKSVLLTHNLRITPAEKEEVITGKFSTGMDKVIANKKFNFVYITTAQPSHFSWIRGGEREQRTKDTCKQDLPFLFNFAQSSFGAKKIWCS